MSGEICRSSTAILQLNSCFAEASSCFFPSAFQPIDYEQAAAKLDEKFHSSLSHYDRDKVQLPPLLPGEAVFVQCEKTKKWEKKGEILEKRLKAYLTLLILTAGSLSGVELS